MGGYRVRVSSKLSPHVTKNIAWNHITNMSKINGELMPYIYMTYPEEAAQGISVPGAVPLGKTLFMSIIMLFGIIPIDFHWLKFDTLDFGIGFQENSTTMLHKYWKHHRLISESENGLEVIDEVEFLPRLPFVGYLLLPIITFIFQHRHRQLRKLLA